MGLPVTPSPPPTQNTQKNKTKKRKENDTNMVKVIMRFYLKYVLPATFYKLNKVPKWFYSDLFSKKICMYCKKLNTIGNKLD